jgi:predicted nucleic acid-binding protein
VRRIPDIQDIKHVKPEPNRLYFFDANVWLMILEPSFDVEGNNRETPYLQFWEGITELIEHGTKVAVNSLVLSEIYNRYLRIGFDLYVQEQMALGRIDNTQAKSLNFKRDYRSTSSYRDRAEEFGDQMTGYSVFTQFMGDSGVAETALPEMLKSIHHQADFNDLYYLYFCSHYHLPIVTHDGDFYKPGPTILTANKKMLGHLANLRSKGK